MWESIGRILTSPNATIVLCFSLVIITIVIILSKTGLLKIKTNCLQLGVDQRERDIIRQQVEWAHTYISGLYSKITPEGGDYNGYFTKYILECIYSEVVDWITFNHIKLDSDYISIKQAKLKALVMSFDVKPEFRTKQFEKQMDVWTEEIIRKLAMIREVYK